VAAYRLIPAETREKLLRYLLSPAGFKAEIQEPEAKAQSAQAKESKKRKFAVTERADRRANDARRHYSEFASTEWVKTVVRLRQLVTATPLGNATVKEPSGSTSKRRKVLADQIRFRIHVLGRKKFCPPMGQPDFALLQASVETMIEKEPAATRRMPAPNVMASRAPAVNSSMYRRQMDELRDNLIFEAEQELVRLEARKQLVASAGEALPPLFNGIRVTAVSKRQRRTLRPPAAERGMAVAAAAVEGVEFGTSEHRTYKVLSVYWSLVADDPLCLFYDVEEHCEDDEAAMLEDPSAFEHAHVSVCEDVAQWVRDHPVRSV